MVEHPEPSTQIAWVSVMHNSHADDRIQTPPVPAAILRPVLDDHCDPQWCQRRRRIWGVLFGAFVGLLTGPAVAGVTCWLTDWYEGLTLAVCVGAAIGPLGGAAVGLREPKGRGIVVRPDIATMICAGYGVLPALLMFAASIGTLGAGFSVLAGVGLACIGPMLGMLIGAVFDRAYEAMLQKAWIAGLLRCAVGAAVCAAITAGAFIAPYGPDPEDLARDARQAVREQWHQQGIVTVLIRSLTVERVRGRQYTGVVDAVLDGQRARFRLAITVDGPEYTWTLDPLPPN